MSLFFGISAGGVAVRGPGPGRQLILQNVGTVPIAIYFNVDGSGDPEVILAAGTVNDDGQGSTLVDNDFTDPIFAKAPAGGGRLLAL